VDRPLEDAERDDPVATQSGQERHGFYNGHAAGPQPSTHRRALRPVNHACRGEMEKPSYFSSAPGPRHKRRRTFIQILRIRRWRWRRPPPEPASRIRFPTKSPPGFDLTRSCY